jgi:hypothetical protein
MEFSTLPFESPRNRDFTHMAMPLQNQEESDFKGGTLTAFEIFL